MLGYTNATSRRTRTVLEDSTKLASRRASAIFRSRIHEPLQGVNVWNGYTIGKERFRYPPELREELEKC